jgi:hypothetical protein
MQFIPSICDSCVLRKDDGLTCDAFPEGIPLEINGAGLVDHREPYPGDNGIRFRLDGRKQAKFDAWLQNR